jgi:RimJ/RimL family protein N-acetyltransferase
MSHPIILENDAVRLPTPYILQLYVNQTDRIYLDRQGVSRQGTQYPNETSDARPRLQRNGFEKVEFRIDERNIQSRKAIEKLGAFLEGILRKNLYLLNGFKRNTCCYGILKEEWR